LKPTDVEEFGVKFNITEWVAEIPNAASEMTKGELAALLVTVTLPERLVAVDGAHVTLKEADCPAATVKGSK
jgi:hypothetical protein